MLKFSWPSSGVKATWNKEAVKPVSLALLEQLLSESDSMILLADATDDEDRNRSGKMEPRPLVGVGGRMLVGKASLHARGAPGVPFNSRQRYYEFVIKCRRD